MIACVLWMKLVSFHHVCWDLRLARREAGYTFLGAIPSQITELDQAKTLQVCATLLRVVARRGVPTREDNVDDEPQAAF